MVQSDGLAVRVNLRSVRILVVVVAVGVVITLT
jgi:hypothetical protein